MTGCWRVFRLTFPAAKPVVSLVSFMVNTSRSAASPLSGVKKSRFFHGASRKTCPSSATERNGRLRMIGRLWLLAVFSGLPVSVVRFGIYPPVARRTTPSGSA